MVEGDKAYDDYMAAQNKSPPVETDLALYYQGYDG